MAANALVRIDNARLESMARNEKILAEFPFLRPLKEKMKAKGSCRPCKKSNTRTGSLYMSMKVAIATMSTPKKKRLKELLSAKQIRVTYRSGSKTVARTF